MNQDVELLTPGETVGPYQIESRIGKGGMGEVWKAVETQLDRQVALKIMSAALSVDPEYVSRFRTEAKAAAALVHPNIVNVFGIGEVRKLPYIAMEYVDGQSLHQLIHEHKQIPASTVVDWTIQAARALEAASKKGVIHRDVKPHNLMVARDGTVKLADFGLAKLTRSDVELTKTGVAMGTPLYMSPEQGRGDPLDWRSDLYSLGATMYHALAGQPPFQADTPLQVLSRHAMTPLTPVHAVNPSIPHALSSVLSKMLAKVPTERHATYAALIADLERVRGALPKSSVAVTPGSGSAADQLFAKAAVAAGVLNAQQLQGARGLQEKLKAAGKPVKSLEEILLAARVLTGEQIAGVKAAMHAGADDGDSDSHHGGDLEVTDANEAVKPAAASPPGKGMICVLCKMEVRPNQVQTPCPGCGLVQHSECVTSFGGCGNEGCDRSPKSMSMAVNRGKTGAAAAVASTASAGVPGFIKLSAVAAVIALAVLGVMKLTAKSAQSLFDEAKALDGERKGRLSIFSIDEANKDASSATGLSGEEQRKLEQQLSLYRQALEKDPAFKLARVELASCLMRLNRRPEALAEFETILQTDPSNKEALLGSGTIRLADGDFGKAEDSLRRAAQAGMTDAWLSLAVIYQDHKKLYAESVEPLRKYTAERATDGAAWARLALALSKTGRETEAIAAADTATRNGSDSPMSAFVKATAAFRAARWEEAAAAAVSAADKLSRTQDLEFEMRKIAGLAYWKSGRPQPAREQLSGARNLRPHDVEVRVGSAELAVLTGDWVDASVQFKEAFDRGSENTEHLFKAGFYRYQAGDGGPAAAIFEELSRHKPNYPDLREWLARAYLRANALESATPAVQRALEEKPDSPTRIACAVWESTLKAQLDAAVKRGEEAVIAYPDCGFLRFRVAEAYRALRRTDMMGQHLAAGAAQGDEECLWAYAEYIYTTGNKEATLKAYQAFLDKVPAGELAKRARQMVLNLTTGPGPGPGPTGTTPPPVAPSTATAVEGILGRLETLVNRPYDPMGEPVDAVYAAMIASTAQAFAAADKSVEVSWLSGDLSRAERFVVEGLSGLRTAAPNVLADARSRRIRDRFAEMAVLSDRFVAAWGAVARKMNPSVGGKIDETVTRWPTVAPKDPFEKVAMAFDTTARMIGLAVGDQGAGEILDRLDAHLLICDNTIQKGVARLHAMAALLTLGLKNSEALTTAFNEADDKAESGLAQMQVAMTKLAEYAAARRAGK